MAAKIIGLGTALPAHSISQTEACLLAKTYCCQDERDARILEQLYRRTEINRRSTVLVPEKVKQSAVADFFPARNHAFDFGPTTAERMRRYNLDAACLSATASRLALLDSQLEAESISHLVTVSCTGFAAPGFDLRLIEALCLDPQIYRTHIGFMGCHGAMNALRVAEGFCAADDNAKVLVCATEICSIHFQYGWVSDSLVANSLFADGSAAIVLGKRQGGLCYGGSRSYVLPGSANAMSWNVGDNGFTMTLSPTVADLIERYLPLFLTTWLNDKGLAIDEVNSWAVHPGGPRILDAVEHCLALAPDALNTSRQVLAECGNMSSPTVLFILQRLLAAKQEFPCVMLGFGPGLTIEAAMITRHGD